jgi:ABC-type lipoprotein export system ATPase subunit
MYDSAMQNKTIIMVTHDNYLMNYAKRHIELKDGHIISDTYVN